MLLRQFPTFNVTYIAFLLDAFTHAYCTLSSLTVAVHDVDLSRADVKPDVWISSGQDEIKVLWLLQQTVHSDGHVETHLTRLTESQFKWQPRKIFICSM